MVIVSGSKLIADDEIASFENEGRAANADVRSIEVGDQSLVSVEVQGKDFTAIPDKTEAAIAILEMVLH